LDQAGNQRSNDNAHNRQLRYHMENSFKPLTSNPFQSFRHAFHAPKKETDPADEVKQQIKNHYYS
jgi:hypothetical protein